MRLLTTLGYRQRHGAWRHPERTAVFVGDFIDRGEQQLETLGIVRAMVDAGAARAVMGNHELNAIGWAAPDDRQPGAHLRPRHGEKGAKNRTQHARFLAAVGEDSPLHRSWVDWFEQLPLWIEERTFRVVHACWSPRHVESLAPLLGERARLTPEVIEAAHRKGTPAFEAVEVLLKGVEVALPQGASFADKEGHIRHEIRTRWWQGGLSTYRNAYIGPPADIPDEPLADYDPVPEPDRPTFIGHYWFPAGEPPAPASRRVACVDYSVAKGGKLVAYRFDGEPELSDEKFVAV